MIASRALQGRIGLAFVAFILIEASDGAVGVLVGVLVIGQEPTNAAAAPGLGLTGFSLGPIFPTTIALMSGLVEARILPSAIGFLASLGSMGAAFFPWLAGNLAQQVGL